jgi:DNA-binding NarL/FixJ family response regulator
MKIYLADDHGLFRSGLKYLLTGLDPSLDITEASTLAELASASLSQFDLVLIDMRFDGADALPLISELILRAGKARVVVISGDDSPERVRRCIDAGAMGFLPKSEDQSRLLPALRLVLSGGIYLPANAIKVFSSHADSGPPQGRIQQLLSARQWEILTHALNGTPNKIISRDLNIAEGTVKAHLSKIYQLIGVRNRTEAVYMMANESSENLGQ